MREEDYDHKIYEALEKACDLRRYWGDPEFHCFDMFSPNVACWPAMNAVESQLSNGGVSQLLWNCLAHWRELLRLAEFGYQLVSCPEALDELKQVERLCSDNEAGLLAFQKKYGRSPTSSGLGKWCDEMRNAMDWDGEYIVWPYKDLPELKKKYLEKHFNSIVAEISKVRADIQAQAKDMLDRSRRKS